MLLRGVLGSKPEKTISPPAETEWTQHFVSNFQYKPLDQKTKSIRLLEVIADPDDHPIQCRLFNYPLDSCPTYKALSYTWEDNGRYHVITCNDLQMKVTSNLYSFLRQVRRLLRKEEDSLLWRLRKKHHVLLWIDQISIDQGNILERNHQVQQMHRIYSTAKLVIVWLGVDDDLERAAFEQNGFQKLPKKDPSVNPGLSAQSGEKLETTLHTPRRDKAPDLQQSEVLNSSSPRYLEILGWLLQKSYWHRMWIIQEFILAQTVQLWCSGLVAELPSKEVFERFIPVLRTRQGSPENAMALIKDRDSWWHEQMQIRSPTCTSISPPTKPFHFRALFMSYLPSKSTEARDKIYALLGIASDSENEHPIVPDYSKTPAQVYVDVVRNQGGNALRISRENIVFFESVRKALGVTHLEAEQHLRKYAPDLWRLIHMLASPGCLYAPVQHISTVTESGCELSTNGQLQRVNSFGHAWTTTPVDPVGAHYLSDTTISRLVKNINDVKNMQALSCRIGRSFGVEEADDMRPIRRFNTDSDLAIMRRFLDPDEDTEIHLQDASVPIVEHVIEELSEELNEAYIESFAGLAPAYWTATTRTNRGAQHPMLCFGTNNTVALYRCWSLLAGDRICTFKDTQDAKYALILRNQGANYWKFIGTAMIFNQGPEIHPVGGNEISPKSNDDALPSTHSKHQADDIKLDSPDNIPIHLSPEKDEMNFFFQPMDLLELFGGRLLDSDFIPRWLHRWPRFRVTKDDDHPIPE